MSSQFDFENEVNNLIRLDAPVQSGPAPRWQRKASEHPGGSITSPLKNSNRSLNHSSLKQRNSSVTLSSAKCATPGNRKKTPNRSLSISTTPCRSDRYIPNRNDTNFELGQFKLLMENDSDLDANAKSISVEEYKRALNENLQQCQMGNPNDKILAFKERPAAAEGYQNSSKVLYSSTKKNVANKRVTRYIPSHSERVLDAPSLLDDFYLNLIDWSSKNILAVALSDSVYLFNPVTGDIELLMTMEQPEYNVCSLRWVPDGRHLAVGTSNAEVQLWDVDNAKRLRNMTGHAARVGCLCWNDFILSSGSRDGFIHHHDVRVARHLVRQQQGHTQEVCGLEWSPDLKYLASGGNDNLVNVWDERELQPLYSFTEHQSAVKALAWCPWQSNVLASGGGSADRHIRFWNVYNGSIINFIDTKSQVCAMKWSSVHKELISSHGYAQNQLTIWSYPSMTRVQDLLGHTARVLYLAMSPDGTTVFSGAADETLRMWECFAVDEKKKKLNDTKSSRKSKPGSNMASFRSIR